MKFTGRPVLLVCEVETADGTSIQNRYESSTVVSPSGPITRVDRHRDYMTYPAADYEPVQPAAIPVYHHHDRDRRVGVVEYLRYVAPPGRIVAVATVDADEAAFWMGQSGGCYVSPGVLVERGGHRGTVLDHLGLVAATARVAAAPVTWAVTTFEERSTWHNTMPGYRLLREAADARRNRDADAGTPIVGHPDNEPVGKINPPRGSEWRHDPREIFHSGGNGFVVAVNGRPPRR